MSQPTENRDKALEEKGFYDAAPYFKHEALSIRHGLSYRGQSVAFDPKHKAAVIELLDGDLTAKSKQAEDEGFIELIFDHCPNDIEGEINNCVGCYGKGGSDCAAVFKPVFVPYSHVEKLARAYAHEVKQNKNDKLVLSYPEYTKEIEKAYLAGAASQSLTKPPTQ